MRSYLSAMKAVLAEDKIELDPDVFLLSALTRACKFKNDYVKTRLPIRKDLLVQILHKAEQIFGEKQQLYLQHLFSALISTAYFGMFRIGEVTTGSHPIRVGDVLLATNKRKVLFILRSSTLVEGQRPQSIKISSIKKGTEKNFWERWEECINKKGMNMDNYCPYQLLRNYMNVRPPFSDPHEPFFVFGDNSPVKPEHLRTVLKYL